MKIYRKTPGITVSLRRATDEDFLAMELRHPDDQLLPAMGAYESWVLTAGEGRSSEPIGS